LGDLKEKQTTYENYNQTISILNTKTPFIITKSSEIQVIYFKKFLLLSKATWKTIYDYLTNEEKFETVNVSQLVEENLNVLNDTLVDWVMTSRRSLEFLKGLPIEGKL